MENQSARRKRKRGGFTSKRERVLNPLREKNRVSSTSKSRGGNSNRGEKTTARKITRGRRGIRECVITTRPLRTGEGFDAAERSRTVYGWTAIVEHALIYCERNQKWVGGGGVLKIPLPGTKSKKKEFFPLRGGRMNLFKQWGKVYSGKEKVEKKGIKLFAGSPINETPPQENTNSGKVLKNLSRREKP